MSILGCEKEFPRREYSLSSDSLIFNGEEIKKLYINPFSGSTGKFQISSYPNWVTVYPLSGPLDHGTQEITIISKNTVPPGIHLRKLILVTPNDSVNVVLKFIAGANLGITISALNKL
ncbi:MAG: hypothetical protein ACP5PS_09935 [Bacteroidales bacterium]